MFNRWVLDQLVNSAASALSHFGSLCLLSGISNIAISTKWNGLTQNTTQQHKCEGFVCAVCHHTRPEMLAMLLQQSVVGIQNQADVKIK